MHSAHKSILSLITLILLLLLTFIIFGNKSVFAADGGEPATTQNWCMGCQMDASWKKLASSVAGCGIAGMPISDTGAKECTDDHGGKMSVYNILPDGGALASINKVMVAMYTTPPATGGQYLADLGRSMGLGSAAYAGTIDGPGGDVIGPVYKLWSMTRTLTYLAFVLVFLAVGFMVMFRQKMNPQTVVTVQAALPGLVIGLILVSFSYLISAFIIDLAFIGVPLVISLFQGSGTTNFLSDRILNDWNSNGVNIFKIWTAFTFNGNVTNYVVTPLINTFKALFGVADLGSSQNAGMFIDLGAVAKTIIATAVGSFIGTLATAVVLIALFIQLLRLTWQLLQSYITIMVTTIISPFIILFSSLPGRRGSLASWWKTLLAHVLVFPAVVGAFLFAGVLIMPENYNSAGLTFNALPLFNGLPMNFLSTILGVGVLLGTPAVPGIVKNALGVKDQGLGSAIGAAAIGGVAAGYGTARIGQPYATRIGARALSYPFQGTVRQDISTNWAATQRRFRGAGGGIANAYNVGPGWARPVVGTGNIIRKGLGSAFNTVIRDPLASHAETPIPRKK